jgi:phage virion morphogenesis protein
MTFDTSDAARIEAHLYRLGVLARGNFVQARREIGEMMLAAVQDNFDDQLLFDGTPMPQSKAARRRQGKTLIKSHRLYDSYVQQLEGDDSVAVGSNAAYARIHHFGGETGSSHRFTMTARPVLGTTPAMERRMGDFLIKSIREQQ